MWPQAREHRGLPRRARSGKRGEESPLEPSEGVRPYRHLVWDFRLPESTFLLCYAPPAPPAPVCGHLEQQPQDADTASGSSPGPGGGGHLERAKNLGGYRAPERA